MTAADTTATDSTVTVTVTVTVEPIPAWMRNFSRCWWTRHPPIFAGGPITDKDRRLALRLWRALPDAESRLWYVRPGQTEFCGIALSNADIAKLGAAWRKRE